MRKLKIALLLSIILPLGLLSTFRLSGIIKEPLTISGNKTLEAVSWSFEKPIAIIKINNSLTHIYSGDILVNSTVYIDDFHGNKWAYGGSDCITIKVDVALSVSEGFISFMNITFWEDYKDSQVNLFGDDAWPKYFVQVENLSIVRHYDMGFLRGRGLKAFVELAGLNNPKSVSFECFADWVLRSPQNYTNKLEIMFELVYFNGTAYNRIMQPFLLETGPDDNNSFEKAREIDANGTYPMLYIGPNDKDDYYKVYLNEGQNVSIEISKWSPGAVAYTNLELYKPDGELAISARDYFHTITYTIDSSGYWFIRVHWLASLGFYTLTLKTQGGG